MQGELFPDHIQERKNVETYILSEAKIGDRVSITHTRPLSSSKHFYLSAIDSRLTDGMRSVPIQGGVPELPPPKTMEQVRKRAAAVEKKRVEDEAKAAAASVRAEAAVQESNGDKREGEAAEISSDQAVGMGEMGRAVESSGADVSPRL